MNYSSLRALHIYWDQKNTCDLKHTATQAVFGDGPEHCPIVFIGEAPGKDEDLMGKPFIGRAGKFLNELLMSIKLSRETVYITNTVKYRPPNNRDPLPKEKEACKKWLYEELTYMQPKLIVFLGRHAMNTFFPEEKMSLVHGKLLHKKFGTFPCEYFLVLYHPAAALYNGSMRETLEADFKQIPKMLKKLEKQAL